MAIDAGIYGAVGQQQVQPQNQLAALGQVYQLKHLQQQGERADRAELQQNALMQLASSPEFAALPVSQKAQRLYGVGAFKEGGQIIESDAKASRDTREAEKAQLQQTFDRFDRIGQIMGPVRDANSYAVARQQAIELFGPQAAQNIPDVYNPAVVDQKRQQAMSMKEQLEQTWKAKGFDADQQKFAEQQRHNAATEGASARTATTGEGNLAVAQQGLAQRQQETAAGRVPAGYRARGDGTMEFIPGGPADPASKVGGGKPLTEGQSRSLVYSARMSEANDIFDALEKGGTTTAIPGSTAPVIGGAITALGGADNQQLVQGKRDFLTAVLRRESGAVISDAETANGDKQYFPQIGDDAKTIAQKKRNRQIAMRGIAADVPEADRRIAEVRGKPAPQTGGASGAWAAAGPPSAPAPPAGAALRVTNAADYANVPIGATYTTPDGKTRRKP